MPIKLVDAEVVLVFSTLNRKGTSMLETIILAAIAVFFGSFCVLDINEEE
jgi:2-polyprenyl-3-methyl-5-hydroxy-6-metoxy-1,4-benzoquinol methylase